MNDSWTGQDLGKKNLVLAYIGAYNGTMLLLYVGTSFFLMSFDAAAFNLSLLSSDFLSVAAGVWIFGSDLSWLYCTGFSAILAGIYLYNTARGHLSTPEVAPLLEDKKRNEVNIFLIKILRW